MVRKRRLSDLMARSSQNISTLSKLSAHSRLVRYIIILGMVSMALKLLLAQWHTESDYIKPGTALMRPMEVFRKRIVLMEDKFT